MITQAAPHNIRTATECREVRARCWPDHRNPAYPRPPMVGRSGAGGGPTIPTKLSHGRPGSPDQAQVVARPSQPSFPTAAHGRQIRRRWWPDHLNQAFQRPRMLGRSRADGGPTIPTMLSNSVYSPVDQDDGVG